jgi:hypothetical protein
MRKLLTLVFFLCGSLYTAENSNDSIKSKKVMPPAYDTQLMEFDKNRMLLKLIGLSAYKHPEHSAITKNKEEKRWKHEIFCKKANNAVLFFGIFVIDQLFGENAKNEGNVHPYDKMDKEHGTLVALFSKELATRWSENKTGIITGCAVLRRLSDKGLALFRQYFIAFEEIPYLPDMKLESPFLLVDPVIVKVEENDRVRTIFPGVKRIPLQRKYTVEDWTLNEMVHQVCEKFCTVNVPLNEEGSVQGFCTAPCMRFNIWGRKGNYIVIWRPSLLNYSTPYLFSLCASKGFESPIISYKVNENDLTKITQISSATMRAIGVLLKSESTVPESGMEFIKNEANKLLEDSCLTFEDLILEYKEPESLA